MMYAVTLPSPHTHKHIHKHNNIHSQYIVPLMMKHTDVSIQVSLANGVHATIYFNVSHLSFDSLNCMTMDIVLWYSLALIANTRDPHMYAPACVSMLVLLVCLIVM